MKRTYCCDKNVQIEEKRRAYCELRFFKRQCFCYMLLLHKPQMRPSNDE